MARLSRFTQKIFGSQAGPNQIAKFGSLFASSPAFTTDPGQAMSLSNWLTGWFGAAIGGNSPAIEDINAPMFVFAYQLAYLMQLGIPEWDAGTTYFIGSITQDGTGQIYVSRTDTNTNNLLTDATNWKKIGGDVMSALGDWLYGGVNGAFTKLSGNTTTTMQILTQTGDGLGSSAAPVLRDFKSPTVQIFTSGSGTYTTPTGVMYIRIRAVGGGGGGGGSGTTTSAGAGGNGGDTTFGPLTASGGVGGGRGGNPGGVGGGASLGSGPIGTAIHGTTGGGAGSNSVTAVSLPGGYGGNAPFFSGGGASAAGGFVGGTGVANTGGGGGGAGTASGTGVAAGGGGGSGGFVDAVISAPAGTYSYGVGAAGTNGTAGSGTGTADGGSGAAGQIIVEEFYQ